MLFVTLHGGKPKAGVVQVDFKKNNVHAYDKHGNKVSSSVLERNDGAILSELRGIYVQGKYLYVVNANQTQNNVLCYEGAGCSYSLIGEFVSRKTCNGIVHPFDLAFDGKGHCYVSSQDSNVVTRLTISADGRTAAPAPLAPALPAHGHYSAGTFVASSVSLEPPTTPVPTPQGLAFSDDGKKKHSVRGIVWADSALYVADQPAACVKVYDANGKFLGQSNDAGTPVHLVVHQGNLYVSGDNHVRVGRLPNPPGNFRLSIIDEIDVKNGGAMAFGDSNHLFIASRTENYILKFDEQFRKLDFKIDLPANPEFLLHV